MDRANNARIDWAAKLLQDNEGALLDLTIDYLKAEIEQIGKIETIRKAQHTGQHTLEGCFLGAEIAGVHLKHIVDLLDGVKTDGKSRIADLQQMVARNQFAQGPTAAPGN